MTPPEECTHNSACRTIETYGDGSKGYGYECPECGLGKEAGTWEDARSLFWLDAEKRQVRRLLERRRRGEELTERERQMIGYSPFGDAHAHNF